MTELFQRDKSRVRENFNAAANEYDAVAELQRTVATRLLEQLDLIRISPAKNLDLGSGTGYVAAELAKRFKRSHTIQLDSALNMLRFAQGQERRFFSKQHYLCADAENLPLQATSIDLIVSSLMLQWATDLERVMRECRRVIIPGGLFLFSSFGPDTLTELRESWGAVDGHVHVNAFLDMHDVGDSMLRAGFEEPVLETERFTLLYEDVFGLMRELKTLGAANVNKGRRKSLTTSRMLGQMVNVYEQRFAGLVEAGKLPATFEVVYGHAWVPLQQGARSNNGIVTVPLSTVGRRKA